RTCCAAETVSVASRRAPRSPPCFASPSPRPPPHGGREMPSLTNLLIVSVVAFTAPFLLGLFPGIRLPSVVLEIVAGIVVGPSVLGLVVDDQAVAIVALIGLTFVLFLAGLEIDFS